MARYIDLDDKKFPKRYDDLGDFARGWNACLGTIYKLPTADVAPKSEVERLTVELDAMRGAANTYKMHYENARKEIERLKDYNTGVAFNHYFDGRKEVAREIFEEIDELIFQHGRGDLADKYFYLAMDELKKKYTEEKV